MHPWDVLLVCVAALVTDAGLRVCLPAAVSAAVDCLLGCGAGGASSGTLCFRSSASWLAVADWMLVFTCCGDGRCAWEAVYSASSPSSKSSHAVSTLWTSSLVKMAAIGLAPADCGGRVRGVPASLTGGRNFRGHSPRSGLLVVFYSISIVFSVKFHGCTVLSG